VTLGRVGSVVGPLFAGTLLTRGASGETVILWLTPAAALAAFATRALGRSRGVAIESVDPRVRARCSEKSLAYRKLADLALGALSQLGAATH
jgi:hypothetical protein